MRNLAVKIFIIIVIGLFIGAVSFYFWKSKYVLPAQFAAAEKKDDLENAKDAEEKANRAKALESNQAEIIGYIEKNIDKLSGEKPVSGDKWSAIRIWFIDDKNFYVDYKDIAFNLRRILVFRPVGGKGAIYEVKGRFLPGENGWILKSGIDISSATPARLYEKSEQSNEWIIK
jgi:hypothetical protein